MGLLRCLGKSRGVVLVHLGPKIALISQRSALLCEFASHCPCVLFWVRGNIGPGKKVVAIIVSNGTPEWLRLVYGVVLVQLAPKIALIGHHSAPLCQITRLSFFAYRRL